MLQGFGSYHGFGAEDQAKGGLVGWWKEQDTTVKVILGVSAAAVIGGVAYALIGGKKQSATTTKAKANKRGRKHRKARKNVRHYGGAVHLLSR